MGFTVHFSASLLFSFLLSSSCGVPAVRAQERVALCDDRGCDVVYFERMSFLDSWKACKKDGGNLATVKRPEEARAIAALLSNAGLRRLHMAVQVWIGLQRQPRQCKPARPLRGFSWITGDQNTEYTNWQREDSPQSCLASRCVAVAYDSSLPEQSNFKWLLGSCFVPVDGYICRYTYIGMCPALRSEGDAVALYATPFNLLTTQLTHLPFGTVATIICPVDTKEERSVLCTEDEGVVGWSREGPLCATDAPVSKHRCEQDNGGCQHFCREAGKRYYCQCSEGFQLADDGQSCDEIVDTCRGAPCQSECLPLLDGYRCACHEGYMLAPDEQGCLDVDECLQSPCEQLCVNSPGSFECHCRKGYHPTDNGECEDVDECINYPCEQACENTPGSHICHCNMGFSVSPEDPRHCQETDECQIPGTCEHMCVNYVGGFACDCEEGYELREDFHSCQKIADGDGQPIVTPNFPWVTDQPGPMWDPDWPDWPPQESQTDWPLDWLTDLPGLQSSDVIWVTTPPQVEIPSHVSIDTSSQEPEGGLGAVEGEEGEQFQNVFQWEVKHELSSTPTHTIPLTTTTLTPDWYYEEEETTTSVSTLPMLTTISEGASNWFSPTSANHESVTTEYEEPVTDYNISSDSHNYHGEEEKHVDYYNITDFSEEPKLVEMENDNRGGQDHFAHVQPTTSTPGRGEVASDSAQTDQSEVEKQTTSTWLLVGLVVPICIFVVVMVALGVVYCARCAVQPRNKTTTDCYHWISGAHDKQGVQSSSAAGKSHV